MNDARDGQRFRIPRSRRLTWDLLWFHRSVPLVGHDRLCHLTALSQRRSDCPVRISWPAMFIRAFALTAQQFPELRQTWYRWPVGSIYQHPFNVAAVTVHRMIGDEPWLFWGHIACPEELSLTDIQRALDVYRDGPVEQVFRKQLQLVRLPTLLRRMIWWWNLNVATARRAKRIGTFFLSTLAGRGTEIQVPPSVHTGCLTYGPLDESGQCRVTLAYDHRVMDGARVAEILLCLEKKLNTTIATELETITTQQKAIQAA